MCINLQTLYSFYIQKHTSSFYFECDPNIFVFIFAKKMPIQNNLYFDLPLFCYPNIFVFVFKPENCICHTLAGTKRQDYAPLP